MTKRTAVIVEKPQCFGKEREPLDPECQKCEIVIHCLKKCIQNMDDEFRTCGI